MKRCKPNQQRIDKEKLLAFMDEQVKSPPTISAEFLKMLFGALKCKVDEVDQKVDHEGH